MCGIRAGLHGVHAHKREDALMEKLKQHSPIKPASERVLIIPAQLRPATQCTMQVLRV